MTGMNKYKDNTLVRKNRIYLRVNDDELSLLREYQNSIRAPGLSQAVVDLLKTAAKQRLKSGSCEEQKARQRSCRSSGTKCRKEKTKKKSPCTPYYKEKIKETPLPPEKNAPARPGSFDFYFSQITDDESLRGLVEEFLNGELRKGVDLARKTDLREHFYNWLPKYRNKLEMKAKQHTQAIVQNEAKAARESDSDALQRKYDADIYAANLPEALAERDRVLAKFGKPWRTKKGGVNNET